MKFNEEKLCIFEKEEYGVSWKYRQQMIYLQKLFSNIYLLGYNVIDIVSKRIWSWCITYQKKNLIMMFWIL